MLDPARLPGPWQSSWTETGVGQRKRAMERSDGHAEGVNSVNRITRFSSDLGIKYRLSMLSPPKLERTAG